MKKIICILFLSFTQIGFAQTKDAKAILILLEQQEKAWNQGALDQFMEGYWENDSLVFVGKNGLTYGYKNTLANYKKNYANNAQMGQLKFTILSMQPLANQYYSVIGKWALSRTIGNLDGHYTLLLRKIKGQWKIIADHSS